MAYATITALVDYVEYNPSSKKVSVAFTVNKTQGNTGMAERVEYIVSNAETGAVLGSGTFTSMTSSGEAFERATIYPGLPSGIRAKIGLYLKTSDDSFTNARSTAMLDVYTPPSPAEFVSYDWDDVRRELTIVAKSENASTMSISAGYSPSAMNAWSNAMVGDTVKLTVKDPNHGTGQIIYVDATPLAYDGHSYTAQSAKISIPVPNPILGLYIPPCGQGDPQYIVDIVEKKADCSITPKWQNGDRVYRKRGCNEQDYLAQENGYKLLQEDNDKIIVEG